MLKLIFKDGVQKEWLIPSEEEISLIERLFGNVKKYVTITIPPGIGGNYALLLDRREVTPVERF